MKSGCPKDSNKHLCVLLLKKSAMRTELSEALSRQGHEVVLADSGRDALQQLMRRTFDVAIIDFDMDDMDSIVFLREAMAVWPWLGVVVLAESLSGTAEENLRELGIS